MTVDITRARLRAGGRTILTIPELRLGPGVHGIIGPNGSGKTTLLRHVFAPDATAGLSAAPAALSRAGGDAAFAGRTVADHLEYAALGVPGVDLAWARARLAAAGVEGRARLRGLSAGERQMLSAIAALASQTPVIMLDEPFNGLDAARRATLRDAVVDVLSRRGGETTMLIASHRAGDLAGLVDDVAVVRDGTAGGPVGLDAVRESFPLLTGTEAAVRDLAGDRPVLARRTVAGMVETRLGAPLSGAPATAADPSRGPAGRVRVDLPDDAGLIDLLAVHGIPRVPDGPRPAPHAPERK